MDPLENAFGLSRCDIHYDECGRGDDLFGWGVVEGWNIQQQQQPGNSLCPFWDGDPWPLQRLSDVQLGDEKVTTWITWNTMFAAVHRTSWRFSSISARCWSVFRSLPDRLHNKLWKVRCPDGSPPMHSFVKDGSECTHFCLEVQGTLMKYHNNWEKLYVTSPSFWWFIICFGMSNQENII